MTTTCTVNVTGNIRGEVRVSTTRSGVSQVSFSIPVCTRKGDKDQDIEPRFLWIKVHLWADLADTFASELAPGVTVKVKGLLDASAWIDSKGNPQPGVQVQATSIEIVQGQPDANATAQSHQSYDRSYGKSTSTVENHQTNPPRTEPRSQQSNNGSYNQPARVQQPSQQRPAPRSYNRR